jgi:hypothetical protein
LKQCRGISHRFSRDLEFDTNRFIHLHDVRQILSLNTTKPIIWCFSSKCDIVRCRRMWHLRFLGLWKKQ